MRLERGPLNHEAATTMANEKIKDSGSAKREQSVGTQNPNQTAAAMG